MLRFASAATGVAGLGVPIFRQRSLEVLAAIEDPEDGDCPRVFVHCVGDHSVSLVMGDAKAGAEVFARRAAQRKERQAFAGRDYRAGVAIGDRG